MAETIRLDVVEDAYVDVNYNGSSFGTQEYMYVRYYIPGFAFWCIPFLKFDIDGIANVESCSLNLTLIGYRGSVSEPVTIKRCLGEWNESTLTAYYWWDHTVYPVGSVVTTQFSANSLPATVTADVTTLVKEAIAAGDTTLTLAIQFVTHQWSYANNLTFGTREGGQGAWLNLNADWVRLVRYADGVNGSDSNNGLTPRTPWLTMNHAALNTPTNCDLIVKNDFVHEPSWSIAPTNLPVKWVNWETGSSLIKLTQSRIYRPASEAMIDHDYPNSNNSVGMFYTPTNGDIIFIEFDINSITLPAQSAIIHIGYQKTPDFVSPITLKVNRLTSTFDDSLVTWNTGRPTVSSIGEFQVTVPYSVNVAWAELDVTDLINAETGSTFGVQIEIVDGDYMIIESSRDQYVKDPLYLVVVRRL